MPSKETILSCLGAILAAAGVVGLLVTMFVDWLKNRVLDIPAGCSFADEHCPGDDSPYWAYIVTVSAIVVGFWLWKKAEETWLEDQKGTVEGDSVGSERHWWEFWKRNQG